MSRGARSNNARPNSELSGKGVVMQKLDAEPDGGRGEDGGRFAEPSPTLKRFGSFAVVRSSVVVLHVGPSFNGDKCLWGAVVEEGYLSVAAGGEGYAVYFDPVVEGASSTAAMPLERPVPCSAMVGGGVSEGLSPGVKAETKVHPAVACGGCFC